MIQIHIYTNKDRIISIENHTNEIKEFLSKIQNKYPDWEEFALSNHSINPIRFVKLQNEIIFLDKTLMIGNLIGYLDKTHKDWVRIGISKTDFQVIDYDSMKVGMLIRSFSSNTNQYALIEEIDNGVITCFQEGETWCINKGTFKSNNYKYKLLCEYLSDKEIFTTHKFPETKTRLI